MDTSEYSSKISALVQDCEDYRDERSKDRLAAMEFYDGNPDAIPYEDGRSKVVSRDVRASIKKVLPSIVRTLFGNEKIVEYQPRGPGDEQGAEQATDYINAVVLPEGGGTKVLIDAVYDALKLRNGVLRWWADERTEIDVSTHTGLTEMAFAQLVSEPDIEVLEHSAEPTAFEVFHSVKIKRTVTKREIRFAAVPPEQFLIHPDATSMEDSIIVGLKTRIRRSDLISMGYDPEKIKNLPDAEDNIGQDNEDFEREDYSRIGRNDASIDWATREVDYWDLYVRCDLDGDGLSELRRMVYAGTITDENILENDYADHVQFCDLKCEYQPHQWEGVSIADDLIEIQRVKTVILRSTLDNIYWQNNQQPVVKMSALENPEAVFEPTFGKPILIKDNVASIRDAFQFAPVPVIAPQAFQMLEYFNQEAQDRTGVSDASAGLAPDALQNMTAKASAMIEQQGIGQTELIVRNLAEGLKSFFRGILRLVVKHQDKPRTVRLRDEWVEFDPRSWNVGMDVSVNVGLGAGTRERDLMMMMSILNLQERIAGVMGTDNPFVKPEQLSNTLQRLVQATGLKSPAMYFAEPDPQEVAQMMEAARNKPNPEVMKEQARAQAQMQVEQMKAQAQMAMEREKVQLDGQLRQLEMEVQRDKEAAQAEADLLIKQKEMERDAANAEREAILQQQKAELDAMLSREQIASNERIAQANNETKILIAEMQLRMRAAEVEIQAVQADEDREAAKQAAKAPAEPAE
jgi:hypothetical protein